MRKSASKKKKGGAAAKTPPAASAASATGGKSAQGQDDAGSIERSKPSTPTSKKTEAKFQLPRNCGVHDSPYLSANCAPAALIQGAGAFKLDEGIQTSRRPASADFRVEGLHRQFSLQTNVKAKEHTSASTSFRRSKNKTSSFSGSFKHLDLEEDDDYITAMYDEYCGRGKRSSHDTQDWQHELDVMEAEDRAEVSRSSWPPFSGGDGFDEEISPLEAGLLASAPSLDGEASPTSSQVSMEEGTVQILSDEEEALQSMREEQETLQSMRELDLHGEDSPTSSEPRQVREVWSEDTSASASPTPVGLCAEHLQAAERPEAVAAFKRALKDGKQRLQAVKLCFVGHARAGKTSTLRSLADEEFNPQQPSTHGVDTCSLTNELLQPRAESSLPWGPLLRSTSVSEILEQSVAMSVAREISQNRTPSSQEHDSDYQGKSRDGVDSLEASPVPENAAVDSLESSSTTSPPEHSRRPALPEVLKMPRDLIARAISGQAQQEQQPVVMQTWDFAGQEMYYTMVHVFLTALGIYVFVLDLSAWLDAEKPKELVECIDFWLAALFLHAPDSQLIIVGSHDDVVRKESKQKRERVYKSVNEHLVECLNRMPQLEARLHVNEVEDLLFFPVDNSRSTREGRASVARLRAAVDKLVFEMVDSVGHVPSRWAHFFHVLSASAHNATSDAAAGAVMPAQSYITIEEIHRLAEASTDNAMKPDEVEGFLSLFHRLGQFLHFQGSPAVVLNPQWLLDAMAEVVRCRPVMTRLTSHATALLKRGHLSNELLDKLWDDERFQAHREILLAFLKHFDLIVQGPDGQAGKAHWLVPHMLPARDASKSAASQMMITDDADSAVVFLDFHGTLRKILKTLLPHLLSDFRRRSQSLRVLELSKDFISFLIMDPSVIVILEMAPTFAPEFVRLEVSRPKGCYSGKLRAADVRWVLDAVQDALQKWLPNQPFSVKVACPICKICKGHLLDLQEVLCERCLFCAEENTLIDNACLPGFIEDWRSAPEIAEQRGPQEPSVDSKDSLRPVELTFLYSCPLVTKPGVSWSKLDLFGELRALDGITGVATRAQVATAESLREALVSAPSVLHLSAHCARSCVLLETASSSDHFISAEQLACMGPWQDQPLVIFLSCNSEKIVQELARNCKVNQIICCRGEVLDSAARLFCKHFYYALGRGKDAFWCYKNAQQAVRNSPNPGKIYLEADKFKWYGNESASPVPCAIPLESAKKQRWPMWSRVDDFISRDSDMVKVADFFIKSRALVVWGQEGIGKSAFVKEFCHHFSAPGGRLFSAGAFQIDRLRLGTEDSHADLEAFGDRFVRVLREELLEWRAKTGTDITLDEAGEPLKFDDKLRSSVRKHDQSGRCLLVIDGLNFETGERWLADALEKLLGCTAQMCILLTARSAPSGRWFKLGHTRLVGMPLPELGLPEAARLFAKRCRRPLYSGDFEPSAVSTQRGVQGERLQLHQAVEQLTRCTLLQTLRVPGHIERHAAKVDFCLPNLVDFFEEILLEPKQVHRQASRAAGNCLIYELVDFITATTRCADFDGALLILAHADNHTKVKSMVHRSYSLSVAENWLPIPVDSRILSSLYCNNQAPFHDMASLITLHDSGAVLEDISVDIKKGTELSSSAGDGTGTSAAQYASTGDAVCIKISGRKGTPQSPYDVKVFIRGQCQIVSWDCLDQSIADILQNFFGDCAKREHIQERCTQQVVRVAPYLPDALIVIQIALAKLFHEKGNAGFDWSSLVGNAGEDPGTDLEFMFLLSHWTPQPSDILESSSLLCLPCKVHADFLFMLYANKFCPMSHLAAVLSSEPGTQQLILHALVDSSKCSTLHDRVIRLRVPRKPHMVKEYGLRARFAEVHLPDRDQERIPAFTGKQLAEGIVEKLKDILVHYGEGVED